MTVFLKRIFYPVGQGAFYSEIFYDNRVARKSVIGTVVYDCGTESKQQYVNDCANMLKNEGVNDIDILFISHFHNDHISHIPRLLTDFNVRVIVLPVISKESIVDAYLNNYIASGSTISPVILFLEQYIDGGANRNDFPIIIRIEPLMERGSNDPVEMASVSIEELIASHTKELNLGSRTAFWFKNWEYIPCNYPNDCSIKLVDKMKKKYPDLVRAILASAWSAAREELSKIPFNDIKDLYKRVYKNRENEESMLVLSRPTGTTDKKNATCLFTGDFPFRNPQGLTFVKDYYKSYWDTIGTIQAPHHGSGDDNPKDLYDMNRTHVVCYGTKNTYNHPGLGALINMTLTKGALRIVTEDQNTLFSQITY